MRIIAKKAAKSSLEKSGVLDVVLILRLVAQKNKAQDKLKTFKGVLTCLEPKIIF